MKGKRIITILLLLFVVFSVGMIIKKEVTKTAPINQIVLDEAKTVVYYFHGTKRCKTCNRIEALTREAIEQNFSDKLSESKLEIKSINVEKSENKHFVEDFQLSMKTVVVANYEKGKIATWENCDKVWQLVGNEDEFQNYIVNEVNRLVEG